MSAKRVSQKVPESGVLRACLDLLAAEKIWHRRWNTGAVKTGKRLFRFGKPGDADILAAPHRSMECCNKVHRFRWIDFLWIECKSDSGKQTADQKEFEREVRGQGHQYLLVRDVDQLRDWLRKHGGVRPNE